MNGMINVYAQKDRTYITWSPFPHHDGESLFISAKCELKTRCRNVLSFLSAGFLYYEHLQLVYITLKIKCLY
jgi:hypothetical protein